MLTAVSGNNLPPPIRKQVKVLTLGIIRNQVIYIYMLIVASNILYCIVAHHWVELSDSVRVGRGRSFGPCVIQKWRASRQNSSGRLWNATTSGLHNVPFAVCGECTRVHTAGEAELAEGTEAEV